MHPFLPYRAGFHPEMPSMALLEGYLLPDLGLPQPDDEVRWREAVCSRRLPVPVEYLVVCPALDEGSRLDEIEQFLIGLDLVQGDPADDVFRPQFTGVSQAGGAQQVGQGLHRVAVEVRDSFGLVRHIQLAAPAPEWQRLWGSGLYGSSGTGCTPGRT